MTWLSSTKLFIDPQFIKRMPESVNQDLLNSYEGIFADCRPIPIHRPRALSHGGVSGCVWLGK